MKNFGKILSILFISAGCVLLFLPHAGFNKVDPDMLSRTYPSYILNSKKQADYTKYEIYYPPVTVLPGSFKYTILPLYEEYQMWAKQFDPLFFATKRINELVTWKDSLAVKRTGKNNSWEELLDRYTYLMDKHIAVVENMYDETVRDAEREETKRYIVQHKIKLLETIASGVQQQDRDLLEQLIIKTFQTYEKKLGIVQEEKNDGYVYSLNGIKQNEDYGEYVALIDIADIPFSSERLSLKMGDEFLLPEFETVTGQIGVYRFSPIIITRQTPREMALSTLKKTEDVTFEKISTSKDGIYYYSDITDFLPFGESVVKLSGDMKFAVIAEDVSVSSPSALLTSLERFNRTLTTAKDTSEYIQKSYLEKQKRYYIVAAYDNEETSDQQKYVAIEVEFGTSPRVRLQKVRHSKGPFIKYRQSETGFEVILTGVSVGQLHQFLTMQNSDYVLSKTSKVSPAIYRLSFTPRSYAPFAFPLLLMGVVGLFLPFKRIHQLQRVKRMFSKNNAPFDVLRIQSVYSWMAAFVHKYTFVLLSGGILYILFEVFLIKRQIDVIELLVCLSFLGISRARRWKHFFFNGIVSIGLMTLILFLLQKEVFRITADWVFLLFIFFVVDLILRKE